MSKQKISQMRPLFAASIHEQMIKNDNIWVVVGDFGFRMWDNVKKDFPDRFINVGASEQTMIGLAVGLALEGKIPVVYTATTFLLYRPFETIRNYLNYEKIPVKLVGAGRDKDYHNDGISHWAEDDKEVMALFKNIKSYWPEEATEIPKLVDKMLSSNKPWYVNLKR